MGCKMSEKRPNQIIYDLDGKVIGNRPVPEQKSIVPKTGTEQTYYKDGNLKSETDFDKGFVVTYHRNAEKAEEYGIDKNAAAQNRIVKQGDYKSYYTNGKPKENYKYLNDRREGIGAEINLVGEISYGRFENDKKHGEWSEKINDSMEEGWSQYYINGRKASEEEYKLYNESIEEPLPEQLTKSEQFANNRNSIFGAFLNDQFKNVKRFFGLDNKQP